MAHHEAFHTRKTTAAVLTTACFCWLLICTDLHAQSTGRAGDLSGLAADFTIRGEKNAYQQGASVTTGDVNGDGLEDLIYGVPLASPNNLAYAGEVHVFLANRVRKGHENIQVSWFQNKPDVIVTGEIQGNRLGTSVATGDINGDGIADLIMGGGGYRLPYRSEIGSVFVLFGRSQWPSFYVLAAQRADVQIIGSSTDDKLGGHKTHVPTTYSGQSVGAFDLNGDKIADLICGAPDASFTVNGLARSRAGATYIFWGQPNWPPQFKVDLKSAPASVTVYSGYDNGHLGACFAGGDFNGDGWGDVAIGEPEGNGPGGAATGNVYVFRGRAGWPANAVIDLGYGQQADIRIIGDNQWDQLGYSIDMGDFNHDRIDDLLIGAWRYDPEGGKRDVGGIAYVVNGNTSFPPNHVIDFNTTIGDLNFLGAATGSWLGYRVRAGDVDADGIDDMILSAPGSSPNFRSQAGTVYLFRGGQALPPYYTIDTHSNASDWRLDGANVQDYSGQTLAVGDVNGDRIPDIVQGGDATAFTSSRTLEGRVTVTYGGPLFITSRPVVGTTMGMKILCPSSANESYICAASLGTFGNQGIPLGNRAVPLDPDWLFLLSLMQQPIFRRFTLQFLDGTGVALPEVAIVNDPVLVGFNLYYSMVINQPTAPVASGSSPTGCTPRWSDIHRGIDIGTGHRYGIGICIGIDIGIGIGVAIAIAIAIEFDRALPPGRAAVRPCPRHAHSLRARAREPALSTSRHGQLSDRRRVTTKNAKKNERREKGSFTVGHPRPASRFVCPTITRTRTRTALSPAGTVNFRTEEE